MAKLRAEYGIPAIDFSYSFKKKMEKLSFFDPIKSNRYETKYSASFFSVPDVFLFL